jgi:plastocyanin
MVTCQAIEPPAVRRRISSAVTRMRDLLAGTAVAGAVLVPALAYATAAPSGSFTAVDYAWRANGTDATSLTVAPGESVSFGYPSGSNFHNLHFTDAQPTSCTGTSLNPRPKGWSGECTFADTGTYPFVCDVHAGMTGRVVVAVPEPTATATPAPTDPGGGTAPALTPTPSATPVQTALKVKLTAKQRGKRVRGSVGVERAGSRLEVTLTARVGKRNARVGRWIKTRTTPGAVRFSVPLAAKALRGRRSLPVTVGVTLTPPGGSKLTRTLKATVTPG